MEVTPRDQQQPMTAHGDMGEFDQLDVFMHAAHTEALEALAARIDVEERLRQLLLDTEHSSPGNRESGSGGT